MINTLFIILGLLIVIDFIYLYKKKKYYEKSIKTQKLITKMAETRMQLIKMVELGEICPKSWYFRYIYTITSYMIRALYVYGRNSKALEQVNIVKKISCNSLTSENLKLELKELNNEQKQILCATTFEVLSFYVESNYLTQAMFKLIYKRLQKVCKEAFDLFVKIFHKSDEINDFRLLENYSKCENLTFCPS